jgi:hypothetical protein
MSRFNAPPPNGDSRRAIQQRAREATQPLAPGKKACWPFSPQDLPANHAENKKNPAVQPEESAPL